MRELKKLVCEECGKEFEYHRFKRCCTDECRDLNLRRRKFGIRQCEQCGKDYMPKRETSRFCKETCTLDYSRFVMQGRSPVEEIACPICGKMFKPYMDRGKEKKYCSMGCTKLSKWIGKSCGVFFITCRICGKVSTRRVANSADICSSDECRKEYARRIERERGKREFENSAKPRRCKECGNVFVPEYGSKRRVFCSEDCAYENRKMHKGKVSKAKRNRVFKRDKYTCKLCGKKLRMDKQDTFGTGKPHMLAPTIDHIVPSSTAEEMGWSSREIHKESNLQAAHFICNVKKGNYLLVQQVATGNIW